VRVTHFHFSSALIGRKGNERELTAAGPSAACPVSGRATG
jgi:hypothetical protein